MAEIISMVGIISVAVQSGPESSWLADYRGATLVAGRDNDVQMS